MTKKKRKMPSGAIFVVSVTFVAATALALIYQFAPLQLASVDKKLIAAIPMALLVLVLAVGFIVLLRSLFRRHSMELDRIGCDLNSYGYGIALAWVVATTLKRAVLHWVTPSEWAFFAMFVAAIVSFACYLGNIRISIALREQNPDYRDGLGWAHLVPLTHDLRAAAFLMLSGTLGFLPTLGIVVMEVRQ